ncbi:MAG: penicillin-binding protein 2 [Patescibacteria group bacterium]|nr:penicillin-binding protein 2 [Patescibacteria group bacterium]MBU2508988.1 penicillin-binding protein 2 [Patescibacteria group bacterium]
MEDNNPFPWRSDGGLGHGVDLSSDTTIKTGVIYEGEITKISGHPVFTGQSIPAKRFTILLTILFLFLGILSVRAFWMQIVRGESYQALAELNRLRQEVILPRRGIIRDRNGVALAENIPSFDVRATERLLPFDNYDRAELLGKVGRTIGFSVGDLENIFESSSDPFDGVVLMRDIPYEQAVSLKIVTANDPAIEIAVSSKRKYVYSEDIKSLSHILGYVGPITVEELDERRAQGYRQIDSVGKTGVESSYETLLRGEPGERLLEVDARHKIVSIVGEKEPVDGKDLNLSIDLELQKETERALSDGMQIAKVSRGAAIVMDPRNGEILAIASLPAYDDNIFSGSISVSDYQGLLENTNHPLLPRAWAGIYPAGSTIKPLISVAGLAEGVITANTTILSVGGINIGPWFFPDWKAGGHGPVNVRSAIAWSVNTFFYYLGGGYESFVGLGVDRMTEWMEKMGLGSKTGIDVPGESTGFVPSKEWKLKTKGERWFAGDTYNLSIGQGDLLVTPLQVASFTSTIANGGFIVRPHLVKEQKNSGTEEPENNTDGLTGSASDNQKTTFESIAPAEAVQTVRMGMREAVTYGSGRALYGFPISVAGKTGTAQWRNDRQNHAWFTAFAPFENPEVVVTVLLEEGGEGSATAVPVAQNILYAWYRNRN